MSQRLSHDQARTFHFRRSAILVETVAHPYFSYLKQECIIYIRTYTWNNASFVNGAEMRYLSEELEKIYVRSQIRHYFGLRWFDYMLPPHIGQDGFRLSNSIIELYEYEFLHVIIQPSSWRLRHMIRMIDVHFEPRNFQSSRILCL